MFSYVCTACGKKTPADTLAPVCGCGGLFELDFKSPKWDDAKIDQKCWSIFRYRDFMAVDGDAWQSVSLGEGMTPSWNDRTGSLRQGRLRHADALL